MNIYTHPANPAKPSSLVLFLHGYGADGQDLLGLADSWRSLLPDTAFVSCDAPENGEMGFGFQWFSLKEWTPAAKAAGALQASPRLRQVIDALLERFDLTTDRLVLVGFSQGTMMSLYTGLRLDTPLAGVLGYSGALLSADTPPSFDENLPQICLIHGEADTVVPVVASIEAERALKALGYSVELHTIPGLPHGIDGSGLQLGAAFLQKVLV